MGHSCDCIESLVRSCILLAMPEFLIQYGCRALALRGIDFLQGGGLAAPCLFDVNPPSDQLLYPLLRPTVGALNGHSDRGALVAPGWPSLDEDIRLHGPVEITQFQYRTFFLNKIVQILQNCNSSRSACRVLNIRQDGWEDFMGLGHKK